MDLHEINLRIKNLNREYGEHELRKKYAETDPFKQFLVWFTEELSAKLYDPCAMVLASVDENNQPDTRVVLLKELVNNTFIFFSSYSSRKAKQLEHNNAAALNFYWPNYSRQIRIRGRIKKITRAKSETYFASRARETQLGAHAWMQSSMLPNREEMDQKILSISHQFMERTIPCPEDWGGYELDPFEYEFFQGRNWRRHDRLLYTLQDHKWEIVRLAP